MKVTASTIEDALVELAHIMERDGDDHTLLFEHLEVELAKLSKPLSAIQRAREIAARRQPPAGTKLVENKNILRTF